MRSPDLSDVWRPGFLPFSAIYIELHYIFSSIWGHKVRHVHRHVLPFQEHRCTPVEPSQTTCTARARGPGVASGAAADH